MPGDVSYLQNVLFEKKFTINNILFLAIRNLFETMDKQTNSFPPILMLQVLHGCYPQFAERAEGGQGFQQQVLN